MTIYEQFSNTQNNSSILGVNGKALTHRSLNCFRFPWVIFLIFTSQCSKQKIKSTHMSVHDRTYGMFVHTSQCFYTHVAKQMHLKWAQKRQCMKPCASLPFQRLREGTVRGNRCPCAAIKLQDNPIIPPKTMKQLGNKEALEFTWS